MGRTTATKRRKKKAKLSPRRPKPGQSTRRKPCPFHAAGVDQIDYKQTEVLLQFVSDKGKMRGRRVTGCCRRHQQQLAQAIKRGRQVAMIHYVGK